MSATEPVFHLVPGDIVRYFTSINGSLGPWLYGTLISHVLFGISIVQIYSYFMYSSRTDKSFEKGTVLSLIILLTAVVIVESESLIYLFIDHYGDPNTLTFTHPTSYYPTLAFNVTINLICRVFFARRAWSLAKRNLPLGILLILTITGNFAAGLSKVVVLSSVLNQQQTITNWDIEKMMITIDTYYISGAVIDVMLCTIICFPLVRAEKGFRSGTDSVLNQILQYMFATAFVTSSLSITAAVLTSQNNSWEFALCQIHPHVFSISVLFSLNSRQRLTTKATSSGNRLSGLTSSGCERCSTFQRNVDVGQDSLGSGIQVKFDRAELIEMERDSSLGAISSNKATFEEKSSPDPAVAV